MSSSEACTIDTVAACLPDLARHLLDAEVSEVMINGDGAVYIESNGEMRREDVSLSLYRRDEAAVNIARQYGEDIGPNRPLLDARLADGSRVAIGYPPCSVGGPTIAIRKFQRHLFWLEELERIGSVSKEQGVALRKAVRERENILIAGSTSTGKTTLVNSLANVIPHDQRVAVIEDTAELQIQLPNLVRFEARKETTDLLGCTVPEVSIRKLVVAVLRQRPDRIILGEVRAEEAYDLLRALNTGHSGSFSTIHANGPNEALDWLSALALMAVPEMSYEIVQRQVRTAFQLVVHLERIKGRRRVASISRIAKYDAATREFQLERVA